MNIKFEIPGKVKAKQSVKFANVGGFVKKYTPADVKEYANWVRLCFMKKYPDWDIKQFENKSLAAIIIVHMTIPKGFSKKKREQGLAGKIRPIVKPDCDNIAKNINDALNGIVYPDDKQITGLTILKKYSNSEYTSVFISTF